jgi:hypothetical protein
MDMDMDGSRSSVWQEREYETRDSRAERASPECVALMRRGTQVDYARRNWNRCKKSTGIGIGGDTANGPNRAATRSDTRDKDSRAGQPSRLLTPGDKGDFA